MNTTQVDLKKAINLVEQIEGPSVKEDPWRLGFHLMPPVGWLNDPNGLCQFNHAYNIFFQYSPFNAQGGIKVWGHYTSTDFINWQYRGTPIVTDQAEDSHGVYSGCAFVEGKKAYLYYTGNVRRLGNHDYIYSGREANTILVETEDMINFSEKECLMTNEDYGEGMSCHVRDPKVWKEGEHYYMVQGARTNSDKGLVLVFESKDKRSWKRINEITTEEKFGYMWECPDLFNVDDTMILSISPQGIERQGLEFWNVYQSGYYIVEGDFKGDYHLSKFRELDRGFDFYAPQTFADEQGRRILIGWMGLPDCEPEYSNPTIARGWQHCLTLPRELHVRGKKVYQTPIKELEQLRKENRVVEVVGELTVEGNPLEEMIIGRIDDRENLELTLNDDICLSYSKSKKEFTLQFLNESGAGRDKRMVSLEKLESLQIFRDNSALEVFINNGGEVFSTRYYPNKKNYTSRLLCKSATLTVWKLGGVNYGK